MKQVIYISPWAYLRSCLMVAWSAFRHPFTTTYIDVSTGKIIKSLCLLLLLPSVASAQRTEHPWDSCVCLPSHGASATITYSDDNITYVISCGHAFQGAQRNKPITVDCPWTTPGMNRVGLKVRLVNVDYRADLSLVAIYSPDPQVPMGKMPYVTPAAIPRQGQTGRLYSVGFDEMKWPPKVAPAHITGNLGPGKVTTKEAPWHGRSGGSLIDVDNNVLVGVVCGYIPTRMGSFGINPQAYKNNVMTRAPGIYVSSTAIKSFLQRSVPSVFGQSQQQSPPSNLIAGIGYQQYNNGELDQFWGNNYQFWQPEQQQMGQPQDIMMGEDGNPMQMEMPPQQQQMQVQPRIIYQQPQRQQPRLFFQPRAQPPRQQAAPIIQPPCEH